MKISIIVAMTKTKVIGVDNKLPWNIPKELQYFRSITLNKAVIMGINTFKSIKMKPLKNRYNIILTSKSDKFNMEHKNSKFNLESNNLEFVNSIQDSILKAQKFYDESELSLLEQEVMIIGGREIYKQFLPLADRLYISIIKQDYPGNVFFPEYNHNQWKLLMNHEELEFTSQIWDKVDLC